MRIVSLIASATEMVHALGLGEFQVGRSHECDYPSSVAALPVCTRPRFAVDGSSAEIDRLVRETLRDAGSVYEVFEELMDGLRPTHILTQTQCRVCAVSLEDVERAMGERFVSRPRVVALEPNTLADIWADLRRVGEACGVMDRAEALIARLQAEMRSVSEAVGARRKRLAVVEWIEPLMHAGHWTPELVSMAGADCVGVFEEPDAIVVAPCGFDLARTRGEMAALVRHAEWPNVRCPVWLADGNQFFNRPGPRVVETLRILAAAAHPDLFPVHEGMISYAPGWSPAPPRD
ncbi:MAG: cobalamin-binding protein [Bryobacteraceae bacterium]